MSLLLLCVNIATKSVSPNIPIPNIGAIYNTIIDPMAIYIAHAGHILYLQFIEQKVDDVLVRVFPGRVLHPVVEVGHQVPEQPPVLGVLGPQAQSSQGRDDVVHRLDRAEGEARGVHPVKIWTFNLGYRSDCLSLMRFRDFA